MVGVTCEKCGATYRFDDSDVPPSGKIIKCTRCGQAITVMPTGADQMGMRTAGAPPARTVFGLGPVQSPSKGPAPGRTPAGDVKVPAPAPRARPAAAPPADDGGLSWDDLSASDLVNLEESRFGAGAELPALPRRSSPLQNLPDDESLDLVAPVGPTPTRSPSDRQAPDLLAPVGPVSKKKPPAPAAAPPEIPDLLAPVGPTSKKQPPDATEPETPD